MSSVHGVQIVTINEQGDSWMAMFTENGNKIV